MANLRTKLYLILIAVFFSGIALQANVMPEERASSKENRFKGDYSLQAPYWGGDAIFIISDEAVTSSNDSLESEWKDITGCTDVEIGMYVDDSTRIDYYIDYSFGTMKSESGTGYLTLAVDSITTALSTSTGKYKGIMLRGAGASGIVNQIPGANWIRWRGYRNSARSETTNVCKVGLKTIKP